MFKIIASNTLAQLVAKFVGAGLSFITTLFIIRLAGPSAYGDLTKSLVLVAVGFTVIDFGLNATGVRLFASNPSPRPILTDIINTRLTLSLVTILILNAFVLVLPGGYSTEIKSVFWVGSLAIFFQGVCTSMNAYFQYRQNYWFTTVATITGALIVAGLTTYYTYVAPSLLHYLLAYTLGYATSSLLSVAFAKRLVTLTFSLARILGLLKDSLTLGGILLASVIASKLDTIILGVFRSSAEVGEYGFAYRIFDVLLVLPVFVMNAMYPQLVKANLATASRLIKQSLTSLAVFGLAFALLTYLAAPWILSIRPGLSLSVTSLRLLSLSLPVFFMTAPLMWGLISAQREKVVLQVYFVAAILNGFLNLILIPRFGAPVAALNTGLTELFILTGLLYYSFNSTHKS